MGGLWTSVQVFGNCWSMRTVSLFVLRLSFLSICSRSVEGVILSLRFRVGILTSIRIHRSESRSRFHTEIRSRPPDTHTASRRSPFHFPDRNEWGPSMSLFLKSFTSCSLCVFLRFRILSAKSWPHIINPANVLFLFW